MTSVQTLQVVAIGFGLVGGIGLALLAWRLLPARDGLRRLLLNAAILGLLSALATALQLRQAPLLWSLAVQGVAVLAVIVLLWQGFRLRRTGGAPRR